MLPRGIWWAFRKDQDCNATWARNGPYTRPKRIRPDLTWTDPQADSPEGRKQGRCVFGCWCRPAFACRNFLQQPHALLHMPEGRNTDTIVAALTRLGKGRSEPSCTSVTLVPLIHISPRLMTCCRSQNRNRFPLRDLSEQVDILSPAT
jgi:hypothetical protein